MKSGFQEKRVASTRMQTRAPHLPEPFLHQRSITCCSVTTGSAWGRRGMQQDPRIAQDLEETLARKTWDAAENIPDNPGASRGWMWQPLARSSISHLGEGGRRQKYSAFPILISVAVLEFGFWGALCVMGLIHPQAGSGRRGGLALDKLVYKCSGN